MPLLGRLSFRRKTFEVLVDLLKTFIIIEKRLTLEIIDPDNFQEKFRNI